MGDIIVLSVLAAIVLAAVRSMVKSIAPQASLLVDAIQGAGKLPFDFDAVQPEFFLVSGQKFGVPSGAAVLYGDAFRPAMKKLRAERHAVGRVPPPFCLLLSETLGGRLATMSGDLDYIRELRERFLAELREALPDGCWTICWRSSTWTAPRSTLPIS